MITYPYNSDWDKLLNEILTGYTKVVYNELETCLEFVYNGKVYSVWVTYGFLFSLNKELTPKSIRYAPSNTTLDKLRVVEEMVKDALVKQELTLHDKFYK